MVNHKELYKLHADFCKFMANPKRIEILFMLGEKVIKDVQNGKDVENEI